MGESTPDPRDRARRARARRRSTRADQVVFALLLAASVGGCLLLVDALGVRSEKVLAGKIVASVAVPTAVLLTGFGRIRRHLP